MALSFVLAATAASPALADTTALDCPGHRSRSGLRPAVPRRRCRPAGATSRAPDATFGPNGWLALDPSSGPLGPAGPVLGRSGATFLTFATGGRFGSLRAEVPTSGFDGTSVVLMKLVDPKAPVVDGGGGGQQQQNQQQQNQQPTSAPTPASTTVASTSAPKTARTCLSRRVFTIRLRPRQLRTATVRVAGKKVAVARRKGRLTARVDLCASSSRRRSR